MFNELIGSLPKKQPTAARIVLSVAMHVALIYGAVQATKGHAVTIREARLDSIILPPLSENVRSPSPAASRDAILEANPLPEGHQIVLAPEAIPNEIPPIDVTKHFDPEDFTGRGVSDGIAAGIPGGTGLVDVASQIWLEADLDAPPRVVSAASPRYPPVLQRAGVDGRVVHQFVIDSTGRAEPGSFTLMASTNEAFNRPAREAILKTVFEPGRTRGRAVRVLVVQGVSFTTKR